jgi:hypothetical protein
MKGKKDFKSLVKLGRPTNGSKPQVTRSVSLNAKVLEALEAQDMSVSAAINQACTKYYLIG